jgi:hypothetical protein
MTAEHIGDVAARVIDRIGHPDGAAKIRRASQCARVEFEDARGNLRTAELRDVAGESDPRRILRVLRELRRGRRR